MAISAGRSSDLFIDGQLVPGGAGHYPNINPATEEVLGTAANADLTDTDRAIEAARRAFDAGDWSTDTALRVRCIRQLRDAMGERVEELREITMAEVGAPRMLTAAAQLEGPIADLEFSAATAENYSWRTDLGVAAPMGIKTRRTLVREAVGVVAAEKAQRSRRVPTVVLGTAHPAKFPAAVEAACGVSPGLPPHLSDLHAREERFTVLPNEQRAVESFVREHSRAAVGHVS